MTGAFIEATLRSLMLAAAVWAALRVFRIRNILAQKAAWTIVLLGALLMPLVLPLAAHWAGLPTATVVLPWRFPSAKVVIPPAAPQHLQRAAAISPGISTPAVSAPARPLPSRMETAPEPVTPLSGRFPAPVISQNEFDAAPAPPAPSPLPDRLSFSLWDAGWFLYFVLASALLLRLLYGLGAALLLVRKSKTATLDPPALTAGLEVRSSAAISSPVTIGSTVLLPADFVQWDPEKLRIVLAHERSHIRQGDFYLQILAGIYAALVWFSPLGWWLKRKLSDLGEAIGDRDGLEEAASRAAYAQILLEFAAAPRPTPSSSLIGVAMARPSSLSRRVERLLNDRAFRRAFSGGRRTFFAMLLVPGALFLAAALVRVQAATQTTPQAAPAQPPITGQSHPDVAPPTVAPDAAEASPQNQPAPAPQSAPGSPINVQVPPIHVNVPAIHVNVPAQHINVPATHVNVPAQHINVPATHVNVPATHIDVPSRQVSVPALHVDVPAIHLDVPSKLIDVPPVHIDVPAVQIDVPAIHFDVPQVHMDMPPAPPEPTAGRSSYGPAGVLLAMLSGVGRPFVQAAPSNSEATFDRTLSISGQLDLSVATGSGNIHLTRGSGNQVVIHGRVRSNHGENEDLVRQIAANPPIEQTGNTVRIGAEHHENWRNIRIDYDIEAPANAMVNATSGSGNLADEGVGQGAKLTTGSGNITATGLEGGFTTQTGSGNIVVNNTGSGEAKAQTGSGNIYVQGVVGSLNAQTGSGDIKASGTPSTDWRLQTGSGNIELSTANSPLTLDASTGSGSISTAQQMAMQVSSDHHHVHGTLNGGGPAVRAQTGSGNIRVQ